MKFTIDEVACIDCGACRRHCPVDCIPYKMMQHQVDPSRCIGCTICYAVCPTDAVIPLPDGTARPNLSWPIMTKVRQHAFRRGPRQVPTFSNP